MASPQELELQLQSLQEVEARLKELKAEKKKEQRREAQKRRRSGAPKAEAAPPNEDEVVVSGAGNVAEGVVQQLIYAGTNFVCPKLGKGKARDLLVLLELASGNYDLVASYVLGQGRQEACNPGVDIWDAQIRSRIAAGLVELCNGVPFHFLRDLLEIPGNLPYYLCRYVVEYHLYHWMVAQNCDKGVYPDSSLIFAQACTFVPQGAPGSVAERMKAFFLSDSRGSRYWLTSFKERWDIQIGSHAVGEDLEPGELQSKAAWSLVFGTPGAFSFHLGPFFFCKKLCAFGSHFWSQKWYPKLGPPWEA